MRHSRIVFCGVVLGALALAGCDSTISGPEGVDGSVPSADGQTSDGQTSDGQTSDGQTSDGQTSDGQTSDGQTSDGQTSDGQTSDGQAPDANEAPRDLGILPDAPAATCTIPSEAQAEDVSTPTTVVGDGSPASCTSAAFVSAVAKGGIVTFNCGPTPITITLSQTAKIVNDTGPKIVIDGGGKVTLSGAGKLRILYQNTCDKAQKWTTSHCNDQDHPQLTVQNLTFIQGNASGDDLYPGGGAIFVRGGRFKVLNCKFFNNVCDDVGQDVGGAAIRTLDQHGDLPVYVVQSIFGGSPGLGNVCSNGGGLSSIGVSYTVINSLFSHNKAIGNGANPAKPGTPGGGSGGAIYNDGNTFHLSLCGVQIHDNSANEGGGAIFFVSNDRSGTLQIQDSTLTRNPSGQFETAGYPGIFYLGKGPPQVINSTITE